MEKGKLTYISIISFLVGIFFLQFSITGDSIISKEKIIISNLTNFLFPLGMIFMVGGLVLLVYSLKRK